MTENMVYTLIPVTAIVMGIGFAILEALARYRNKREMFQLHHAERMAAIEKGLDVPPLPPEFFLDRSNDYSPRSSLRRGLIWSLLGGALTVALFTNTRDQWAWGLIPTAIGVANLIFYRLSSGTAPQRP